MGSTSLFQDDIVTATAFTRRPGEILDRASRGPVTVTRNAESFVILRRQLAAGLVRGKESLEQVVGLVIAVTMALEGKAPGPEHPFHWIRAFDRDDLAELMREISTAWGRSGDRATLDRLDAVIHEWRESAFAVESPELAAAFMAPADETPLSHPQPEE